MNFSQLKARAAYLGSLGGFEKSAPQPDWGTLVNQGLTDFAWDSEYYEDEATFFSIPNQAEYTLVTPYWKEIKEVAYGTSIRLTKTSEAEERAVDLLWFLRAAGTPSRYLISRPNVLRLVDKPATSVTVTVRGVRVPPALVAATDLPLFPDTWHEAAALRAAILHCQPWVTGDDAEKIAAYREQYSGMVGACKAFVSGARYPTLTRRVSRPSRRRVFLSGYPRY